MLKLDYLREIFIQHPNIALTLTFFTTVIVIYSIFVFYFYRFLAKKDILELNLNQYTQYSNIAVVKFFAILFYIIEYLMIMPILTFFWFSIFSILILLLAKGIAVKIILLISASLVAAVRITAYINNDLAKDLAKMLPFTLLVIAIMTPGFFNVSIFLERISEIPSLLSSISYYLLFIVAIELIMRTLDLLQSIFQTERTIED